MDAVIFDMDGVLVDSEPTHERIEKEMFRELGIELAAEEHRGFQGTSSVEMWQTIVARHSLSQPAAEFGDEHRRRFLGYLSAGEVPLIEGVLDLLQELTSKGHRLALASSSVREVVQAVLDTLSLSHYFDVLTTGDEVEQSKPAPDIFLMTASRLGVTPGDCLVVEDSKNGVRAAKAAGMTCVRYDAEGSGQSSGSAADHVVTSMSELSQLLTRLLASQR
jgi:HAD superfamily hydrolase (TIGR01509 family)